MVPFLMRVRILGWPAFSYCSRGPTPARQCLARCARTRLRAGMAAGATCSEPSRDRDFLVRVELDAVAAVDLQIAEEAVLCAAEREVGHRGSHADVDPHHRRVRVLRELSRRLA